MSQGVLDGRKPHGLPLELDGAFIDEFGNMERHTRALGR